MECDPFGCVFEAVASSVTEFDAHLFDTESAVQTGFLAPQAGNLHGSQAGNLQQPKMAQETFVLPVPGGPSTRDKDLFTLEVAAWSCASFKRLVG